MEGDQFPDRCLNWLASREGSVRRPFVDGSGRPGGKLIETQLTKRLAVLAEEMAKGGVKLPALILLAGGAGNGKSEALEFFLEQLAKQSKKPDAAIKEMQSKFALRERAIDLSLGSAFGLDGCAGVILKVVQDASEGDKSIHRAGSLLLQDIAGALDGKWVLASCVNRGILESARAEALNTESSEQIIELLNMCIKSLDKSSRNTPCWPLNSSARTYVWPMDIESLAWGEAAPVDEIILSSVDEAAWSTEVVSRGSECVLAQNRERLSNQKNRNELARFLRGYEVVSGSLWSFRNLFSLLGFVLSGGSTLREGEVPSQLSQRLVAVDSNLSASELTRVRFERLRSCYEQQLFPRLPEATWFKASVKQHFSDISELVTLSDYLATAGDYSSKYSVENVLAGEWSNWLDPARERSEAVESVFNGSISRGSKRFENDLSSIETQALSSLATCEEKISGVLTSEGIREDKYLAGKELIWFLRRLAAVFVKRSLGVRGLLSQEGRRLDEIQDFLDRCKSEECLQEEARLLEGLFADPSDDMKYVVRADHVIGQPTMESSVKVIVEPPTIEVVPVSDRDADRPMTIFREFVITSELQNGPTCFVPYDFPLFQRLRALESGLLDDCMDPMLRGVLDQAKISLDGLAVRGWGNQSAVVAVGESTSAGKRIKIAPRGRIRIQK